MIQGFPKHECMQTAINPRPLIELLPKMRDLVSDNRMKRLIRRLKRARSSPFA
jgi:hypothetical protein